MGDRMELLHLRKQEPNLLLCGWGVEQLSLSREAAMEQRKHSVLAEIGCPFVMGRHDWGKNEQLFIHIKRNIDRTKLRVF